MRITELILELQKALEEHGDLECVYEGGTGISPGVITVNHFCNPLNGKKAFDLVTR